MQGCGCSTACVQQRWFGAECRMATRRGTPQQFSTAQSNPSMRAAAWAHPIEAPHRDRNGPCPDPESRPPMAAMLQAASIWGITSHVLGLVGMGDAGSGWQQCRAS